ncbi:unnamed protein product [Closterium sp. Naga37s-1]|nr:unnamed protein product [Closterium sp. Naga37s-1]
MFHLCCSFSPTSCPCPSSPAAASCSLLSPPGARSAPSSVPSAATPASAVSAAPSPSSTFSAAMVPSRDPVSLIRYPLCPLLLWDPPASLFPGFLFQVCQQYL